LETRTGECSDAEKSASSKATVGSAYGMAPAYPKTNSAIHGRYPNAFVVETPYELMGFRVADEKIMQVPLDWIGFHYYTRRIVSDSGGGAHSGGSTFGTEIEQDTSARRDPTPTFTQSWSLAAGIYDLVMQITREYNRSIIEITESGCSYLDAPYEKEGGHVPDTRRIDFFRAELGELSRAIADGANVRAFHAWSLLDNFEWADG
jgi:beta-glucosidase